ncbi:MAG: purine-nucleoside phosphorylase, partial [Saprospiraceae bacterium]|nr:purine-nucleoside phosphorylase [Saprospiraceae bacterium]
MIDITTYYNHIQTATAFIKNIFGGKINVALTLGTGLSGIKGDIDILHTIPYNDIPHFPQSTVEGHEGHLLIGNWHGVSVM